MAERTLAAASRTHRAGWAVRLSGMFGPDFLLSDFAACASRIDMPNNPTALPASSAAVADRRASGEITGSRGPEVNPCEFEAAWQQSRSLWQRVARRRRLLNESILP